MKVTVLGAAGGIGQALSLLLKDRLPPGSELALYDIARVTPGIAVDLSHIPTPVAVQGWAGGDAGPALAGADIVLIVAGVARKPGMDRADLFNVNADIVRSLVAQVATHAPAALVAIITNPVNTLVPIAAQVLEQAGVYNKHKLFGVTTLDVIRSATIIGAHLGQAADGLNVRVIGGHSGLTILPLLSQLAGMTFSASDVAALTRRIQNAGTEVVEAKAGGGSATLSMGYAAARFALSLVRALQGEIGVIECAYVEYASDYTRFFARPVLLGPQGIEQALPLGELSQYEQQALQSMLPLLQQDIDLGLQFIDPLL